MKVSKRMIKEINKKVELYSLLWYMKVYNFEMEKIRNSEQNLMVDSRFPSFDIYINEMKKQVKRE